MMHFRNKTLSSILLVGSLILAATSTQAQSLWSSEVELGAVFTSGNTDQQTIKFRGEAIRDSEKWKQKTRLDILNASENDVKSAQRAYLFYQGDYKLSVGSLFGRAAYEDDKFNGFDYQTDFTMGYSRPLYDNGSHKLVGDVGLGYRISEFSTGVSEGEAIVRLAADYAWDISENAQFRQLLSTDIGADSTISRSESSVSANIAGDLAMKFSINVKNNSDAPLGTKKTDTESAVTLVYKF
ncbi:MAG: putative salt-induced outer membrane protein [Candidatus Azotimanducaceae bacterium]|jgi:putative salt-induced outer membrane protein